MDGDFKVHDGAECPSPVNMVFHVVFGAQEICRKGQKRQGLDRGT